MASDEASPSPDRHRIAVTTTPMGGPRRVRLRPLPTTRGVRKNMSRRMLLLSVLLTAAIVAAVAAGLAVAGKGNGNNKTFQYAIGLWGDLPYSDMQATTGVPNLIADMNSQDISFSVHDGDLKAGNGITGSDTPTTCQSATSPSIYSQALGYFNSLNQPAIFTPGDNDWTDCDRVKNGSFNS